MDVGLASRRISLDEHLVALGDIPDVIPRPMNGRKVSRVTVYRWTKRGLAGVAPLETMRIGGSIFTSREALGRFFDRVGEAKDGRRGPRAANAKAGERAAAELAAAGM